MRQKMNIFLSRLSKLSLRQKLGLLATLTLSAVCFVGFQNASTNTVNLTFGSTCPAESVCNYTGASEYYSPADAAPMSCASGVIRSYSASFYTATASESCLNYVKELCNDQASCSLEFGDTNCGGDPDYGVRKMGSATITCSPLQQKAYNLSQIAVAGQDLDIPLGEVVTIDESVNLGSVTIEGVLKCPTNNNSYTLGAKNIMIDGAGALFICGQSAAQRFTGHLKIAMLQTWSPPANLNPNVTPSGIDFMEQAIMVSNGGSLKLFGDGLHSGWTQLSVSALPGAKQITVEGAVDWQAGDDLAIAPTGYDPNEVDRVKVASVSVNGNLSTVTLTQPLRFKHFGELQTYKVPVVRSNGISSWTLNERAEVADLTRNIKIYSQTPTDSIGMHSMIMYGGHGYIDGVEFANGGQSGLLARYPFHWHRAQDVRGQFIRNSSIHDSFQRCVTVHGTFNSHVSDNVCVNHLGHGFFLEGGDEVGNIISGNLGMQSRRPLVARALLDSDTNNSNPTRWIGPSTFWISNPQNTVQNNTSAGSEGTGFWNSFNMSLDCDDTIDPNCILLLPGASLRSANSRVVTPDTTDTTAFLNNRARTNVLGITWEGVASGNLANNPNNDNDRVIQANQYQPPDTPTFSGLVVAKSLAAGMYGRSNTMIIENSIFADNNGTSGFFAFNQLINNSAFIGMSKSVTNSDFQYLIDNQGIFNGDGLHSGLWVYDGPFHLTNVDFLAFPSQDVWYDNQAFTPTPFVDIGGENSWNNLVQGLEFSPEPVRRFSFQNTNWSDQIYAAHIIDLDGSLTGMPNSTAIHNTPFSNLSGYCSTESSNSQGQLNCNYTVGQVNFVSNYIGNNVPFQATRIDNGGQTDSVVNGSELYNKFAMILNNPIVTEYDITPAVGASWSNILSSSSNVFWIVFGGGLTYQTQITPVFRFVGVGNCSVQKISQFGQYPEFTIPEASSLSSLQSASSMMYYPSGNDLYAKFQMTDLTPGVTTGEIVSSLFQIKCD